MNRSPTNIPSGEFAKRIADLTFIPLNGFKNIYEITTTEPYLIRRIGTHQILDEWYNGYGEEAYFIDGRLYTLTEIFKIHNQSDIQSVSTD